MWTFDVVQLQRRGGDGADCARHSRLAWLVAHKLKLNDDKIVIMEI